MVGTPAIRNLIREAKVAQMYSAIQTGQQFGMQTLDQNLQDLVKKAHHLARRSAQQGGKQGQLPRLGPGKLSLLPFRTHPLPASPSPGR
jgi:twitching motility protein PilT